MDYENEMDYEHEIDCDMPPSFDEVEEAGMVEELAEKYRAYAEKLAARFHKKLVKEFGKDGVDSEAIFCEQVGDLVWEALFEARENADAILRRAPGVDAKAEWGTL